MSTDRLSRTMLRRGRFRSRSLAVAIALVLVALGAAYLGTEAALAALGYRPLLVAPAELLGTLSTPDDSTRPWMLGGAALTAVLGLIALIVAVTPGRRSRHELADDRLALLVDDDVLAGAISRGSAAIASVSRSQVSTVVSSRRAIVAVQPSSGFPVASSRVTETAEGIVAALAPRPALRVAVAVADRGVVGA